MTDFDKVSEQLERDFASAKDEAAKSLRALIAQAEHTLEGIEQYDGFVGTFASGGPTFDVSQAQNALSALVQARSATGIVRNAAR